MDNILNTLKVGLSAHLEKQGSNLEELETSLANLDQAQGAVKVAELLCELSKEGFFGEGVLNFAGNVAKSIPELGMTTALLAGSSLGAGAYGISKHLDNQDKELGEKEQEVNRIKSITDRLKSDYGIKHHG